MFVREMAGAYKVISKYNVSKTARIYEKIFDKKKNKKFLVKNDVLLFELKDNKAINYCLNCMHDNYDVLNGYIKILKNKKRFKNIFFHNGHILGQNYNKMNPEKLNILYLLNDEFSEIERKFEFITLKANIIIFSLFILIILIITLFFKKIDLFWIS